MKPLKYILGVLLILGFMGFTANVSAQDICPYLYETDVKSGCSNGIDDDCDLLSEADGHESSADPLCAAPEFCDDPENCIGFLGTDNDSCQCHNFHSTYFTCYEGAIVEANFGCVDGIDNDGDGDLDCDDYDCRCHRQCVLVPCPPNEVQIRPEVCNTCKDEDYNGLYGCDDPVCSFSPFCQDEDDIEDAQNDVDEAQLETDGAVVEPRDDKKKNIANGQLDDVRVELDEMSKVVQEDYPEMALWKKVISFFEKTAHAEVVRTFDEFLETAPIDFLARAKSHAGKALGQIKAFWAITGFKSGKPIFVDEIQRESVRVKVSELESKIQVIDDRLMAEITKK